MAHITGPDTWNSTRVLSNREVAAAYIVGNGLKPFPTKDFGAPVTGISQTQLASVCLPEVPPHGAKVPDNYSSFNEKKGWGGGTQPKEDKMKKIVCREYSIKTQRTLKYGEPCILRSERQYFYGREPE